MITRLILPFFSLFLLFPGHSLAQPDISATSSDSLIVDQNSNNTANPGDVIQFDTVVENSGTTDAINVEIDNPIDPNTTLVPGSLNVSPVPFDDSYVAVANVQLVIDSTSGVFANDSDVDGDSFILGVFDGVSEHGGRVVVNFDGSFTYDSAYGFTGIDTFTYSITDSRGFPSADSATVTINVSSTAWFIDNSVAVPGFGTLVSPFNSIAAYNAAGVGDVNDIVFIYGGFGPYAGDLQLKDGQQLIGQGVDLILNSRTIVAASYKPVLNTGTVNSNIVTAGNANLIEGLTLAPSSASAVLADSVNGITIRNTDFIINGPLPGGLELQSFNGAANISNTTFSGSGNGFALRAKNGSPSINVDAASSFTFNGGFAVDIQNVSGGTSVFASNINNDNGLGVVVFDTTDSANITFSGTLSVTNLAAGIAVGLVDNENATITFAQGVLISTSTSGTSGLYVRDSGTVNILGTNSQITHVGGDYAIEVLADPNTTSSGASGWTFDSITATGGASGLALRSLTGNLTVNNFNTIGSTAPAFDVSGSSIGILTLNNASINGSSSSAFAIQGAMDVSYRGSIVQTSSAALGTISGRTAGSVTFDTGTLSCTGSCTGLTFSGSTGTSDITFSGPVDLGTAASRLSGSSLAALNVDSNSANTLISFSDLDIYTDTLLAFRARSGAAPAVLAGRIDSASSRAVDMQDVSIPSAGVAFSSISGTAASSSDVLHFDNVSVGDFNGGTITAYNGSDGLEISNSSSNFIFSSLASDNSAASGLKLISNTGAFTITGATTINLAAAESIQIDSQSGALAFSDGSTINIDRRGARGLVIANSSAVMNFGNIEVVNQNGHLSDSVVVSDKSGGSLTFNALNVDGYGSMTRGVDISNNSVPIVIASGSVLNSFVGGVRVDGGDADITISMTLISSLGRAVEVQNRTGGAVVFDQRISNSFFDATPTGLLVSNNTGGSTIFSGANSELKTGTHPAVTLSDNTGHTVAFTGGGLDIETTSAAGFAATGGGSISVEGTGNTVTTTTGRAVDFNNTSIASAGVTFESVSANGADSGVVLSNIVTGGSFSITGTGASPSGGTIANTTGDAVVTVGAGNFSFNNMNLINAAGRSFRFAATSGGTVSVTNSGILRNAHTTGRASIDMDSSTGLSTLTVSGISMTGDGTYTSGVIVSPGSGASTNVTIQNSSFNSVNTAVRFGFVRGTLTSRISNTQINNSVAAIIASTLGGTVNVTLEGSTFATSGATEVVANGGTVCFSPSFTSGSHWGVLRNLSGVFLFDAPSGPLATALFGTGNSHTGSLTEVGAITYGPTTCPTP